MRFKWIIFTIFIVVLTAWSSYEIYFKYVINDYKKEQLKNDIRINFYENKDSFNKLRAFSQHIGTLELLEFRKDETIRFQIYDTLIDRQKNNQRSLINYIGEGSDYDFIDVEYMDNNSLKLLVKDSVYNHHNWIIEFNGKMTNPLVEKVLAYNKITLADLTKIKRLLKEINCQSFDKVDDVVIVRYKGHFGESFNYALPLVEGVAKTEWKELEDNYYWFYYDSGFFFGVTDW